MDARGLYQIAHSGLRSGLVHLKIERVLPRRVSAAVEACRAKKKAPPGRSQLIDHRARPDMRIRERPDPMTLPKCWLYRIEQFDEIASEPDALDLRAQDLSQPLSARTEFNAAKRIRLSVRRPI